MGGGFGVAASIDLSTFIDDRGRLTVIQDVLPAEIRRVFYIYDVEDSVRGKHRHKKTIQVAVSIRGSCTVQSVAGPAAPVETCALDSPSRGVRLQPSDFHWMQDFSRDCILMVLASEVFDANDYIYDPY